MSLIPFAFGFLLGYTIAAGQHLDQHVQEIKARRRARR